MPCSRAARTSWPQANTNRPPPGWNRLSASPRTLWAAWIGAWTTSNGSDDCSADPSAATVGGPDAYWHSYTYDLTGNRTTETRHATSTGHDTITRAYDVGTPGQPNPQAVQAVTTTGDPDDGQGEYSHAGETIAMRNNDGINFLFNDPRGTALIAVSFLAGQGVTRRRQLPFGDERNTTGSTTWPGDKGFLDGTKDLTDLTHLRAVHASYELAYQGGGKPVLNNSGQHVGSIKLAVGAAWGAEAAFTANEARATRFFTLDRHRRSTINFRAAKKREWQ
ncbi:hypothetical protein GCM10009716_47980 [Streptomyces sodiiphilus]|uniref:RHS repeat-associated core domain-containing protein n=2 Tax=Streptomyces sodiiphilus TaxID=226217 RepID=A0ABN2PYV4_9ACTN